MKKYFLRICILMLMSPFIQAQTGNYKVVFDMSSRDSINQQAIVREIGLITGASPDAKLEVVIYGQGLDLAIKNHSCPTIFSNLNINF